MILFRRYNDPSVSHLSALCKYFPDSEEVPLIEFTAINKVYSGRFSWKRLFWHKINKKNQSAT